MKPERSPERRHGSPVGDPALTMPFIDLRQLRYCLAALDHGSFRKAAAWLGVRESTVSRRIRDLESALGAPLFVRHPGGVDPTEAGRRFGRHAREILRALGDALREVGADRVEPEGNVGADVRSAEMGEVQPSNRPALMLLGSDRAAALVDTVLRLVEMLGASEQF